MNLESELTIFILCILSIILNETIGYHEIGIIFVVIQIVLILFYFLKNNYLKSLYLFFIFTLTALEFPADLKNRPDIYTFRTVDIFGFSVSTWILILFFLYFSFIKGYFLKVFKHLTKEQIILYLLFFSSILIGVAGNIFSDYNIQYFVKDLQYYLVMFFSFHLFLFVKSSETHQVFENIILYTLISRSWISFLGINFGLMKGNYGGIATFSYEPIDILIIFLIFAVSRNNSFLKNSVILISWVLGIISSVFIQSSGKSILLLFIVLIEILVLVLKSKNNILKNPIFKVFVLLSVVVIVIVISNLLESVKERNLLLSIKLNQAQSLVQLDWLKDPYKLPNSPRDRVLEIYNTFYYYVDNPYFFPLGAGIGGYFKESKYYNYTANDQGGYSTYEVESRHFYSPHESPANVFLKFGIAGVIIYVWLLLIILRDKENSLFFKNIAFFLVLLFIGFSIKLAIIIGYCLSNIFFKEKVIN